MGSGPRSPPRRSRCWRPAGVTFEWEDELAGVAAVDATGTPLPDATIDSIRRTRLALKGPLTTPVGTGFRSVNVGLRKEFELYANVRPARTIIPGGRFENVDIVMVRENLEGLYVGYEHFIPIGDDPRAVGESIAVVTRVGCERVIRYAFEYAVSARPQEGHHRAQGEHPQDGERPLPRGREAGGRGVRRAGRVERHDRGQHGHAAGDAAGAVRRDGDDQHVRRHPERRGVGAGGRAGARARRQHRDARGDLRGGARQRARHRGEGRGQPVGADARGGDDARPPRRARCGAPRSVVRWKR